MVPPQWTWDCLRAVLLFLSNARCPMLHRAERPSLPAHLPELYLACPPSLRRILAGAAFSSRQHASSHRSRYTTLPQPLLQGRDERVSFHRSHYKTPPDLL